MTDKNLDVLFYVPSKKENVDEPEKQWINNLKYILEISLNQVLKRKANCNLAYENDPIQNSEIYIQCFLGTNFSKEKTIQSIYKNEDLNIYHVLINTNSLEFSNALINLKTYRFYNEQTGKILDLTLKLEDILNTTWLKISDLSFEIGKVLRKRDKKIPTNNKIFIAETSPDQTLNRNYLVREFKHQGYTVVPEDQLPNDIVSFSDQVQNLMEESLISIHLIGNNYAPLLNNIEISKVELQNDIFNEVIVKTESLKRNLQRLVLIPPALKPKSDKQKKYIDSFKLNIELQKNTEIIQSPLEDFKSIIQKKVDGFFNENTKQKDISINKSKKRTIYIIGNGTNTNAIKDLKEVLNEKGFDFAETINSKNKIELIKDHQRNLTHCDGVIVYYSSKNEQWLNSKLSDIVKSPGIGRNIPFLLKAILIDGLREPKIEMNIRDLLIVNTNKPDYLNHLLEKIK
jgi:hypothetical protein